MSKARFLFIFLLAGPFELSVLAQDTTYFNSIWKPTSADSAAYYRIKIKKDSGWQVTDHFLSGKIQMTGSYADDSLHVNQGVFTWYDNKGVPTLPRRSASIPPILKQDIALPRYSY